MHPKERLRRPSKSLWIRLSVLFFMSHTAQGIEFTGHHGGVVTNCKDPEFYRESPAANTRVSRLEKVTFMASDNTMPESIQVWINLEPTKPRVTQNGNGTFTVEIDLSAPKTAGRAWIKVTGHSDDGCQQIHTWDVFVEPDAR